MKKKKYLKTRAGIFKNMVGNIPGGNFPGGNLIGGNFPGGSFPDTEENICKEFSSVHALTLIFIKKIFILQTHSPRVFISAPIIIFSYGAEIFLHLIGHVCALIVYIEM